MGTITFALLQEELLNLSECLERRSPKLPPGLVLTATVAVVALAIFLPQWEQEEDTTLN